MDKSTKIKTSKKIGTQLKIQLFPQNGTSLEMFFSRFVVGPTIGEHLDRRKLGKGSCVGMPILSSSTWVILGSLCRKEFVQHLGQTEKKGKLTWKTQLHYFMSILDALRDKQKSIKEL